MLTRTLVLALCLVSSAAAQNGSTYHVLNNGQDVLYPGVGAGTGQLASDGIGTWIAGEDLRGSRLTQLGDFGFRITGFDEVVCVMAPPPAGGYGIKFPVIAFVEMSGLNPNSPAVFLDPACSTPSFPLGTSGFVPYGLGPGSSASFVTANLPLSPGGASASMLLPNVGLAPAGAGGSMSLAGWGGATLFLPSASAGLCWTVQFTFAPSAIPLHDDIDGLWHWAQVSPDNNQYWGLSDNEQNIWQSQSVATSGGLAGVLAFPANADYALTLISPDPCTLATLAPRAGTTPYSAWTTNVTNEYGVAVHPNGGFDIGRGSAAISFSGLAGVPNPVTGVGNQNPGLAPGTLTTLGFATFEGASDPGSVRLTWLSVDVLGNQGIHPATDPGLLKQGGTVRVPVTQAGMEHGLTTRGFQLFGHVTQPGFVNPLPSFFAPSTVGGASWQLPVGDLPAACTGTAFNLTYGTTGRTGTLGAPGRITFDPAVAAPSTARQLFLFD